jgi:replicative DNA helicase
MIDQQNTPGARARRPRQQTGPEAITPEVSAQYLPPMSVEAEQAVIGAMLISPLAIEKAAELLKPEDFYRENHKLLFESIVAISARSEPVDLVTIQEELQNRGALEQAGGIGYITSLLGMLTPVSHVEHHAKIVDEKAILRRLIDAAMQIIGLARNPEPDQDVASVLDQAEKLIFGVSQRKSNQSFSPLSPLLVSVYDRAEELNEMKTKVSGVATGITEFDYITAGLQKTDLVILAARPSMGKTSFALSIAQHVAIHERKHAPFSRLKCLKNSWL